MAGPYCGILTLLQTNTPRVSGLPGRFVFGCQGELRNHRPEGRDTVLVGLGLSALLARD